MSCTRDHAALKRDASAWSTLLYRGVQVVDPDDGLPPDVLELRDCTCGSTLAININPAPNQ